MTSNELLLELAICFALLIAVAAYVPFDIWIKAKINKIEISLVELTFMRFRKTDVSIIISALMIAKKNQIQIDPHILEGHYFSGGNIVEIVQAAVIYKERGYEKSIPEILASDLHGNDVIEEAKSLR